MVSVTILPARANHLLSRGACDSKSESLLKDHLAFRGSLGADLPTLPHCAWDGTLHICFSSESAPLTDCITHHSFENASFPLPYSLCLILPKSGSKQGKKK